MPLKVKNHDLAMRTTTCPACRALPGSPCVGKKRERVHPSRIKEMKAPDGFVHPRLAKFNSDAASKKFTRQSEKAKSRDFYSSWEWKKARYAVLKIHGHRCQCCGWRPGDTDNGYLVVDHIQPRKKRPDLALNTDNLQVLCNDCNMGKSNVHEDDFRGTGPRAFDRIQ